MDVFEAIKTRRSIRSFSNKEISEEDLNTIMEAGRLAPSGNNHQPYKFVVIKDKALIKEYASTCCFQEFISDAAVIIVGCVEKGREVDGAIAVQNMVLEATELRIGACWVGWFDREKARALLNIPTNYEPFITVPMGYPKEYPAERPKKPLNEIFVYNKF